MARQEVVTKDDNNVIEAGDSYNEATGYLSILSRALQENPDYPIEKLQTIMDMQFRVMAHKAKMEYLQDMAKLQGELPAVERLHKGQSSMYARFDDIITAIKPIMLKYGFSISHRIEEGEGFVRVIGILGHKGGHEESTTVPLPLDKSGNKNAIQSVGSSWEYGRRYTTNALLGIATKDADTDGNKPKQQVITPEQVKEIEKACEKAGVTEERFLEVAQVPSIDMVHPQRFNAALAWIEKQAESDQ